MIKTLCVALGMSACMLASSCNVSNVKGIVPSKEITNRNIKVDAFTRIVNNSVADVEVSRGATFSVTLVAPTNYLQYFDVKASNGQLVISQKDDARLRSTDDIEVLIQMPAISEAQLNGTGDMNIGAGFETNNFKGSIGGTGDLEINMMNAGNITLNTYGTGDISFQGNVASTMFAGTSGTGDIEIKGQCATATYQTSGSGEIEAAKMMAEQVTATTSGTGDIECYAKSEFRGTASGIGDIIVYGNPARRTGESKNILYR